MTHRGLIRSIVVLCTKLHKELGCGIKSEIYEKCFLHELEKQSIFFESRKSMPIIYDDLYIEDAFVVDLIVDNRLIIGFNNDIDSNEYVMMIQNQMNLCKYSYGLVVNINANDIKDYVQLIQPIVTKPVVAPMNFVNKYYSEYYNKKG